MSAGALPQFLLISRQFSKTVCDLECMIAVQSEWTSLYFRVCILLQLLVWNVFLCVLSLEIQSYDDDACSDVFSSLFCCCCRTSYLVDYYLGCMQILSYAKKNSFGVCCWFWQKLQVAWSCIMDMGCTWWCMWNMPHGFWWLLPWLQNAWRRLPSQFFHKSSTPNFIVSSSVCFCSFCRHINNSMLASLPFTMLLERVE